MAGKILVVDDEENIRSLVRFNLEKEGFVITEAADGAAGLKIAQDTYPDLVVLDLMLPFMDGLEVCRQLKNKRETSGIAIIMLTAKADEVDKVLGLELGADDYLTKPFSPRELTARVKAVLRRGSKDSGDTPLIVGRLQIDPLSYSAYLSGEKLELTPKEYELLKILAANTDRAFTREELLEKIWGYEYYGDTRTVDVHIRHLRVKLSADQQLIDAIETIRGVGYKMSSLKVKTGGI